jgi:hypothetical protein
MEFRDYPPAPQIHRPNCPGIPPGALPVLTTPEIARRYPNGVMHNCYHFKANPNGFVEPVVYPEHDYKPSTLKPADARRPWCGTCRGTHGAEQMDGDGLLLPGQYQRILLPGESAGRGGPGGLILPGNR